MIRDLAILEESLVFTPYGKYTRKALVKAEMTLSREGWILRKEDIEYKPEKEFSPCKSYEEKASIDPLKIQELAKHVDRITIKKVERQINECKETKYLAFVENDYLKVGGKVEYLTYLINYLKSEVKSISNKIVKDYQVGGKVSAILSPEVFGTVISYVIKNLLSGDQPRVKLYDKIFPLTVLDNPLSELSPAFSTFDDEGVATRPKELVGDGNIEDHLGTLYTKFGTPGNARGIPPQPDFYTIEIKGGDWDLNEMVEENKDNIIIYGVSNVEIVENSVRITPKIVERNGIGIRVREIAVPYQDLFSIEGLSRVVKPYALDENHGVISPYALMPVRIILF